MKVMRRFILQATRASPFRENDLCMKFILELNFQIKIKAIGYMLIFRIFS